MKEEFVVRMMLREKERNTHYVWIFDTLKEVKDFCESRLRTEKAKFVVYQRLIECEVRISWDQGGVSIEKEYALNYFAKPSIYDD